ncbi:unnamed protein product [Nezara viridula]|uniref:Kinesin-like protein n=1 Tax=Nezara viridula TaxID=85310 RepID=A0A9P0H345_NEZVI|nr:unnamed protein product [Nezara viridula]
MGDVNQIKNGMSIQIRRTDGRTHPAIVSSVNNASRSVTVEWFEKGETKGKEIEFDAIYALNMHLQPSNINNQQTEDIENKLSRDTPQTWDEDDDGDEDDDDESQQDAFVTDCDNGNVKEKNSLSVRSLPNPKTFSQPVVAHKRLGGIKPRQTMVVPTNGTENLRPPERVRGVENIPPVQIQQTQNYPPTRVSSVPATIPETAANFRSKRSNVVKEVEKLKKNREERRLRQAEKKEEKEALMNMDPGNPNWQFSNMIKEYRNGLDFRPLRENDIIENHQITVCVRKRPLNRKENLRKEVDVITVPRKDIIVVHEPKNKVDLTKYLENQQFRFDYAFDELCSNEIVYKFTAKPLVQTIFDGGMATCFAYGQTGSGKTHTMGGIFSGRTQDCKKGIYALAAVDVFKFLASPKYSTQNLIVTASFFEIYSGKVFDLLADKAKLRVLEDGKQQVQVVGLTERVVTSVDQVLALIQKGNQARTSGQTSANTNSSRSHAVFQITLRVPGSHYIHGKFSLIDLAGNERGADTSSADRLTRMEGAEINKSLLALKECIRALGRKGAHLPFRASKLTQVLRDSFIGDNTKTCMIAMISPGMSSCEHSLNTLRYADRVKELAANDPSTYSQENSPVDENHEDSDLAALRSLNENEISADLYDFHEAVSQLNKLEEEMLDNFKTWRDSCIKLDSQEKALVAATNDVDYDQDAFATKLDLVLNERQKVLSTLREKVAAFRQQLIAEEEISKKMTPPQHRTVH